MSQTDTTHSLLRYVRDDILFAGNERIVIQPEGCITGYLENGIPFLVFQVHQFAGSDPERRLPPGMHDYLQVSVMLDLRVVDTKANLKAPFLETTVLLGLDDKGTVRSHWMPEDRSVTRNDEGKGFMVPLERSRTGVIGNARYALASMTRSWEPSFLTAVVSRLRGMARAMEDADTSMKASVSQLQERALLEPASWLDDRIVQVTRNIASNMDKQHHLQGLLSPLSKQLAMLSGVPNDGMQRAAQVAARLVEERQKAATAAEQAERQANMRRAEREAQARRAATLAKAMNGASERILELLGEVAAGDDRMLASRAATLLEEIDPDLVPTMHGSPGMGR